MATSNNSASDEKAEEFSKRISTMVVHGFTCLGILVGQRLGLFEAMGKFTEPQTSQQIANSKGYKERYSQQWDMHINTNYFLAGGNSRSYDVTWYVREWLGIMVTAKIINISEDGRRYFLPKHRLPALTQPEEISVNCPIIPMFCKVENELYDAFQDKGPNGIPYSSYPDFQQWKKRVSSCTTNWSTLEQQLTLIPGIIDELQRGIEVCDMGTGAGILPLTLAERFPSSTFWGLDISEEGIATALKETEARGLKNIQFAVQDISAMPEGWADRWDLVYMNHVAHDVPHASRALQEVHRVLRPGGYMVMIDEDLHTEQKDNVGNPYAQYLYTWSLFHCMPVSLAVEGGEGLGAAWGIEKATQMVKEAGFTEVRLGSEGFQMVCRKAEKSKM